MPKLYRSSSSLHLDVLQGSREERTELYAIVLQGSTAAADAVMRQKRWRCSRLGWLAGQRGGGA